MKDGNCQRINTGFPSWTGAPYYMEMPTFSALIKNIEKKFEVSDFMFQKLHLYTYETLWA